MKFSKTNRNQQVFSKFGGRCAYCGQKLSITTMTIDHVIPKKNFTVFVSAKMGIPDFLKHLKISDVNSIDNLFPSCNSCNSYKADMGIAMFRAELIRIFKRLYAVSPEYRMAKKYGLLKDLPKSIIFYFETIKNNEFEKCRNAEKIIKNGMSNDYF